MKKVCAILGLSLCVAGGVIASEGLAPKPSEQTVEIKNSLAGGEELLAALRSEYSQGKFRPFLESMEADYQELRSSGRLQEFSEMRQPLETDVKLQELAAGFENMAKSLLDQRNSELKAACDGLDGEPICKIVHSAAKQIEPAQEEALRYLSSLRFKTPSDASGEEERKLIEIDLAYEFKSVHLDAQSAAMPGDDLLQKQIVLGMERIREMQQAANGFSNEALKKSVELAASGYDARESKAWDLRQLAAIAKKPSGGDLERKVASILNGYKAKKDDLYQREFLAKLDS